MPAEVTGEKEYEIPVLDEDAYVMQKLWDEKEHWKKIEEEHDKWREKMLTEDMVSFYFFESGGFTEIKHFNN